MTQRQLDLLQVCVFLSFFFFSKFIFVEPWEKNLYRWHVRLFPPADSDLYKDLQKTTKKSIFSKKVTNEPCIELEMLFPSEYPNGVVKKR